jgi:hypothetical protein
MTQQGDGSTAQQVKDQVKDVAWATEDRARDTAGQAKRGFRDQVDRRSTEAGQRIGMQAGDVRSMAEELRRQGKDGPARVAEQLADRAERFAGYLERSDGDRILRDVEGYARRNPWAVAAGALAAGFAASRFLKASSGQRYRSSVERPLGSSQRDAAWQPAATSDAPVIPAAEPPIVEPGVEPIVEPGVESIVEPEVEPVGRPGDPTYGYDWRATDRPAVDPER